MEAPILIPMHNMIQWIQEVTLEQLQNVAGELIRADAISNFHQHTCSGELLRTQGRKIDAGIDYSSLHVTLPNRVLHFISSSNFKLPFLCEFLTDLPET